MSCIEMPSVFFTAVFRRKPRKPENPGTMAGKTQKSGGEKNLNAMETGRGFRSPKMNPRGRDCGLSPLWPFGIQGGSNALALFFRGVRKQADCLHTVTPAASRLPTGVFPQKQSAVSNAGGSPPFFFSGPRYTSVTSARPWPNSLDTSSFARYSDAPLSTAA